MENDYAGYVYPGAPDECRHLNKWNDCQACLHSHIAFWVEHITFKWIMMEIRAERQASLS